MDSSVAKEGVFFSWLAARGVILTEELRKRKVVFISWCYLCKEADEEVDHLLQHFCQATTVVGYVQLVWYVLGDAKVCQGYVLSRKSKRKSRARNVIPLALVWFIWKE